MVSKNTKQQDSPAKRYALIGVDGEGYFNTEIHSHQYDVLTVGDITVDNDGEHLSIEKIASVIREQTFRCLDRGLRPVFIGYFFNYDFSQFVRSLDDFELNMLYARDERMFYTDKDEKDPKYKKASAVVRPVRVDPGAGQAAKFSPDRFKIDYLESKWVEFKFPIPESLNRAQAAGDESKIRWVSARIQDVGTVYGGAFIEALDSFGIEMTEEESFKLHAGKTGRAINCGYDERMEMIDEIIDYNRLEISLVYRLIGQTAAALNEIGYDVDIERDLSGIGSLAGQYLSEQAKVNEDLIPSWEVAEVLTPHVYRFVNDTYFGGWAETLQPGTHDRMFQVDITSAYPDAMRNLPSLKDAAVSMIHSVEHAKKAQAAGSYVFADVSFESSNDFCGPLPFRTESNSVLRPVYGRGRYYWGEIEAAHRAGLLKGLTLHEAWAITPVSPEKPFQYIEDLFNDRLRVGKKTVKGNMLKLILNSQYGKVAQSVGNPKFANPVYASLITASARIKLLDAIGSHPDGLSALLATATDAVFFKSRHEGLDYTPNKLGAWEEDVFDQSFLLKPGIWGGMGADDPHGEWSVKTRGVSHDALVDQLFSEIIPKLEEFKESGVWDEDYAFKVSESFSMLSLGEAANRGTIEQVGEFMTGDHGIPEEVRDVSFSLSPKRLCVFWSDEDGCFSTRAPFEPSEFLLTGDVADFPVSMSTPSVIGNVDFSAVENPALNEM